MNVSQQNIDDINAIISIDIVKADYSDNVEKTLRSYRQKANIPGFRKGMVPMGMIKKMFGKSILAEEINKQVSEKLFGYIRENNLNILGEPLPDEAQEKIDFDNQEDFTFKFDIALAPKIDVNIGKDDQIDYYQLQVNDDMLQKQIDAFASRFGTQIQVEEAGEKDMLKAKLTELDENGQAKEGGVSVSSTILSPVYFKNDEQKTKFAGVKVGDKVVFNPYASSDGSEAELASMLRIDKEKAADMKSDFEAEILEITGFKPAEMNQEFFDNVLGADKVKTEEEFRAQVKEMIAGQMVGESDYKFGIDARKAIEEKVGEIVLPEAFLKRWLLTTGENKTPESVDADFAAMVPDLKWHLIKEEIVRKFGIKVEEADIMNMAKKATKAQFAQYGMMNVPEEMLENYAKEMLKTKESVRGIIDRATEEKILDTIKENVTLNTKEISPEDFYKLFETK